MPAIVGPIYIMSLAGDAAASFGDVFAISPLISSGIISVFFGKVKQVSDTSELIRVTKGELEEYAFPVSHQKIWKMADEGGRR